MRKKIKVASGVGKLDRLLGGMFIGDNVVWHDDSGSLAAVFCFNFMKASQVENKPIIYVSFDRSPKTLMEKLGPLADYPNLIVLDCFTNGKGSSSPVFVKFYEHGGPKTKCRVQRVEEPRSVQSFMKELYEVHEHLDGDVRLVFESLTGMEELWGGEEHLISFYSHSCPRLYELETVAYWIMEKNAHSARLRAQIAQIAQVVIDLSIKRGTTLLSILKAENREAENLQTPYRYWAKDVSINFDLDRRATGGLDLGQRIKELRTRRGLSQTELARMVGVTPSTISQVESNLIYPSLPALLKMAEILAVDVSALFQDTSDSRGRAVFSSEDAVVCKLSGLSEEMVRARRLIPIDYDQAAEPYLVEIAQGKTLPSHFFLYKGEEFGYLISGHLDLKMDSGSFSLQPGDLVYLTSTTPTQWKNPGPEPARLFWVKIK